jgi:hypothetical protein
MSRRQLIPLFALALVLAVALIQVARTGAPQLKPMLNVGIARVMDAIRPPTPTPQVIFAIAGRVVIVPHPTPEPPGWEALAPRAPSHGSVRAAR